MDNRCPTEGTFSAAPGGVECLCPEGKMLSLNETQCESGEIIYCSFILKAIPLYSFILVPFLKIPLYIFIYIYIYFNISLHFFIECLVKSWHFMMIVSAVLLKVDML